MTSPRPPYRVPTMAEIAALPWNGLKAIDLFSGCGGTCLGLRLAGFRVLWANEFVPIAQDSYRANAATETVLDCRDIREVEPGQILEATKLKVGDVDLCSGSAPCQAYSMSGKRAAGWGKDRTYAHGASQRNEDMFFEFVRIRDGLQPKVFVAENVTGLVKGAAKGYFLEILKALKNGYQVEARVLDAQWLGVPQQRQRVIFVGVRNDLRLPPAFPSPLPWRYSIRDALIGVPDFVEPESDISRYAIGTEYDKLNPGQQSDRYFNLVRPALDEPCPTITAGGGNFRSGAYVVHPTEKRKFSIAELRRLCSFPDDFQLMGTYGERYERLGNSVPPFMAMRVAEAVRDGVLLPALAADRSKAKRSVRGKSRAASRQVKSSVSSPVSGSPERDGTVQSGAK